jgi:signal peptidase I
MTFPDGPAGPERPDAVQPPAAPVAPDADPPQPVAPGALPRDAVTPDAVVPEGANETNGGRAGAHRAESRWRRLHARRAANNQPKIRKPHKKAPWWELPLLVAVAILIAIVVKTFVIQPFYIPSESMEKTLHGSAQFGHDRILVNKLVYDFRDPHPGDIVVFHAPPGWDDEPTPTPPSNPVLRVVRGFGQLVGFIPPDGQVLVKRVIATGGQTVEGDSRGHILISTHGTGGPFRTLTEPYVWFGASGQASPLPFGPVTVPKGRLWVMGDNRNDSKDSRYHCNLAGDVSSDVTTCDPKLSTVPVDDVIGKAFVVAWPPSHWRTLGTPSTFKNAALAGASDMPGIVSAAVVLPLFFVRRRRRRRR